MGRFDGRVAIITGAARGIGAGTAKRFADEGAAVAVLDLDESQAQATAESLGAAKAIGVGCNVADEASAQAAVDRVLEELGGLHILVNNAGITRDNLLFKMSDEDWDSVLGVHLRGAFLMSQAAQKTFMDQKYGKILNTSTSRPTATGARPTTPPRRPASRASPAPSPSSSARSGSTSTPSRPGSSPPT